VVLPYVSAGVLATFEEGHLSPNSVYSATSTTLLQPPFSSSVILLKEAKEVQSLGSSVVRILVALSSNQEEVVVEQQGEMAVEEGRLALGAERRSWSCQSRQGTLQACGNACAWAISIPRAGFCFHVDSTSQ
jgi:hypothetical protein